MTFHDTLVVSGVVANGNYKKNIFICFNKIIFIHLWSDSKE
jgi:hypothetical protein|nr:MAG TPA: hypothetical protein [Caudoviricetes sp.]